MTPIFNLVETRSVETGFLRGRGLRYANVSLIPWYTENIACRAELGRYPLSIDIKASISSYWQRLKHSCSNVFLSQAFQYTTTSTPFFDGGRGYQVTESTEPVTRQHIKNGRLKIKKNLGNQYSQNWLETKNSSSTTSSENLRTGKFKKNYQFENYLKTVTNPAHRISLTKLRLGCQSLRIKQNDICEE